MYVVGRTNKDIEKVKEKMYSDDVGGIVDQMCMKNLSKRKAAERC